MSAYFAPLVILPVVITAPGEYVTRDGERVTISKASSLHDFGCTGTYAPSGETDHWHRSGRMFAGRESRNDIVRAA